MTQHPGDAVSPFRDLDAPARHWAVDEIRRVVRAGDPGAGGAVLLGGGETYSGSVTWMILVVADPAGREAKIPVWHLMLTRVNPVPGEPALSFCRDVGSPEPAEEQVRAQVRAGITALRALHAAKRAAINGQPPPAP